MTSFYVFSAVAVGVVVFFLSTVCAFSICYVSICAWILTVDFKNVADLKSSKQTKPNRVESFESIPIDLQPQEKSKKSNIRLYWMFMVSNFHLISFQF